MITKKEIEHIARLARIEFAGNELQKFEKDLAGILDFVAELNKADTAGVEPMAGGLAKNKSEMLEDSARKDEALAPLGTPAELVNAAPGKELGFIEVKSVFKE